MVGVPCPNCGDSLATSSYCPRCGRLTIPLAQTLGLAWVVPIQGTQEGKVFPLAATFVVGTHDDCHLRPDNPHVSAHHARFILGADGFRVEDNATRNGTFVNEVPAAQRTTALIDGDKVRFADYVVIFKCIESLKL